MLIYNKFYIVFPIFLDDMKCEICKKKIEEIFLDKILGTYIKDKKGKKHTVCQNCQKEHKTKEELLKKI